MTQSSTSQASDLPKQRTARRPSPSPGRGRAVLTFLFRLLLLGISGSLASLLGIAIAQFYPGRIQEPPLVEKFMQGTQVLWQGLTRLPESWNDPSTPGTPTTPTPSSGSSSPIAPASPEAPLITTPPPVQLSDADRQQAQTELSQLQRELQQLDDRADALSTRIGAQDSTAPLEQQLQTIQQQLDPNAVPPTPTDVDSFQDQSFVAPATSTIADGELLKVTLPSDALFRTDQTTLRPETTAILDSLISDLQRYPSATIRVIGHTDSQGAPDGDRSRSFEQATAITQYLSGKLGEGYQWVTVGYGSAYPLAENTSAINRQRNRRIEIVIDPD